MSFTLKNAMASDAAAIAHLHVQGWRDAYGGLLDADYIESQTEELRTGQWQGWLAEGNTKAIIGFAADGTPAGFIGFGKLKTPPPGMSPIRPVYASEIYAFYILADYWRQGLGTQLLKAGVEKLAEEKSKSVCLWVLEKNNRAVSFYKKTGGERCGKKDVEFGSTTAREVCFGWRDTSKILAL